MTVLRGRDAADIRAMVINHQGWDPGDLNPANIKPMSVKDEEVLRRFGIQKHSFAAAAISEPQFPIKAWLPLVTQKETAMPLKSGKSKSAFKSNVRAEVAAGRPVKQAVAVAYSQKRRSGKKR